MISYELAKKLKENGFKQGVGRYISPEGTPFNGYEHAEGSCFVPSLSELIEACPKKLKIDDLHDMYFTLKFYGDNWLSGYTEKLPYEGDFLHIIGEGSTAEEAVANLRLELNKK